MFGFVTANLKELSKEQRQRYLAVYCGICRGIRQNASQTARLGLSYDMAFLALLLMSLYEPEEISGDRACMLHPLRKRPWVDNEYILAYYKAQDDLADDGKLTAKVMSGVFERTLPQIRARFPRQCQAMERCIRELSELEKAGCDNPDLPAGCFGRLMGELLVYREDLWANTLRQLGDCLGRYIYLLDAMVDYRRDSRKNKYNPFLAMGSGQDLDAWEQYLILEMARCAEHFEKLPLVQDKPLLNSILYSGVWMEFERLRPRKRDGQEERT